MPITSSDTHVDFRAFGRANFQQIPQVQALSKDRRLAIETVASVLPFRVNSYVVDELIDWSNVPDDPIFQMTFPQEGMLSRSDFTRMRDLLRHGAPQAEIRTAVREIQDGLNPHPAGQLQLNVPDLDGETVPGVQHKYRETLLFFPRAGQTCHAYCTYCFRWAQFVGIEDLKFASGNVETLVRYLRRHPKVTDVLFTGGDPLIMKTSVLRRFVEPLLSRELGTVDTIRLGTKSLAYWPQRFVTDKDADDLLRLFEQVRRSGRHLALMSHYSHPRELDTPLARKAVRRILGTGAVIRCQAPIIRHVNDHPDVWARMWKMQVKLGAVPYYMFVERDTGPKAYFEVPLAEALRVYQRAFRQVSGLARTVRGPSMSATPGKVLVDGVAEIEGRKHFVLKFLQARVPEWTDRVFFAEYDPAASWLDDLQPSFGEGRFFFESEATRVARARLARVSGDVGGARRVSPAQGESPSSSVASSA